MMILQVNGEEKRATKNSSVADALVEWGYSGNDIAIAINGEFVPRSSYTQHQLREKDNIEIVAPIQGG